MEEVLCPEILYFINVVTINSITSIPVTYYREVYTGTELVTFDTYTMEWYRFP